MSKILITGCFGFIGSRLYKKLIIEGHDVYGIGRKHGKNNDLNLINSDINETALNTVLEMSGGKLDLVIHTAGSSSVGFAEEKPALSFENTVVSSQLLFEWIRNYSPKSSVVVTSSAAVYGNIYSEKIQNGANTKPFSVYGEHKLIVENLGKMYNRAYGTKIKFARIFSVYGPGLRKQFLWDFCSKLEKAQGNSIELFGSGEEIRDWVYIDDACEQIVNISRSDYKEECYNVGSGIGVSVKSIAEIIMKETSIYFDLNFNLKSRKGDPFHLVSEGGLIATKVDVKEGIKRYVQWFKCQNKAT
ncbi:SDR family oxidoreductase [Vibrio parahaemolyticus]|uniref:Putative UDP-glucose epimerase n=1 Tax=Vibrio parahaemolyticus TaxID=670 RepID=A0A5Q5AX17_VIBPH|nr:SDR family oxidoreductase [Vibrio parahaemolyticus]EGV1829499.1 SDR family oxidoreductase [Vibrio parahaemolyticus]EHW0647842.1 SDR family oxidoreductase [Vibrio parahaemolyticus]KYY03546.1 hypothetical protein AVR64_21315 [Vibrio parahaemolyticus]MBE4434559.1 SDR family oxidoreductase [Vibrio parahaemolyticus]MCG0028219.1 SDR family oxidoreductase [Vibrio parahaemolyticus]